MQRIKQFTAHFFGIFLVALMFSCTATLKTIALKPVKQLSDWQTVKTAPQSRPLRLRPVKRKHQHKKRRHRRQRSRHHRHQSTMKQ